METIRRKTPYLLWPALAAALCIGPAFSQVIHSYVNNSENTLSTPRDGRSPYLHYVDWSLVSYQAGHNNYSTMDGPHVGVKYMNYTHYSGYNQPGRCFELTTSNAPAGGLPNTDTQILVKNSSGIWVNLSDDYSGTYYSHAFIYFYGGSNTRGNPKIRIAAYSSDHNWDAFMFSSSWFSDDFNNCMVGDPNLINTVNEPAAYVDYLGNVTIYRAR